MQHWRVPFLGLQAIPPELTDFEIRYFFSYTAKERAAIFSRYGDRHRLAVALQIGMLKMTGRTLDAFETVPPPVLRHLQTHAPAPHPGTHLAAGVISAPLNAYTTIKPGRPSSWTFVR